MLLFQVIGLGLLITIIVIGALMSLFGWRKWCEGKLGCCDRKVLYDKLILEEERQVLKEILREDAKKKLKEEIERKIEAIGWKDCFDVAEEVIKTSRLNIPNMESQQLEQLREQSAEQSPEQPQRQDAQVWFCLICQLISELFITSAQLTIVSINTVFKKSPNCEM